jgi:hypothetical protein
MSHFISFQILMILFCIFSYMQNKLIREKKNWQKTILHERDRTER